MNVLGIETSCDETAVAIYNDSGLCCNEVYSQIDLHQAYGGVVPELAARDHLLKILPLLDLALKNAGLQQSDIDFIAYTKGPGLMAALMVGVSVAKALAYALNVPTIGVHHLEAHLMAAMLENAKPQFPFLGLLVSGGHTLLIEAKALGEYSLLGETLDDAIGEAFDKTAKLLGLPYPGGPLLAKLAEEGDPSRILFPRPMTNRPGLDMSFSGLKTAVLTATQTQAYTAADIAASFQAAAIDTLKIKTQRALKQTQYKSLVVAGGVSANLKLRSALTHLAKKNNINVYFPKHEFCTDNAAMVAVTGYMRAQRGDYDKDIMILPKARWPLITVAT